jgi:transposase-like protein
METPAAAPSTPVSTSKSRTRCNWSAEERAEWIGLFEESGQTATEFCRQNDLPVATLSWWRSQLRGDPSGASDGGELIELPQSSISEAAARVDSKVPARDSNAITLRIDGVELTVPAGTDIAWLTDLIRALHTA